MKNFKNIYSINFDKIRRSPKDIIYIIFHYTGMMSEKKAIDRLVNKKSKVSSHYFIKRDGTIINMVPERFTAWHAGLSCWKSHKNLNNKSIGIEIQNSGHINNYEGFSIKQIKSLLLLTKILKKTYNIKSKNFLGHSDIAPNRKIDPGEKFPWKYLSKYKIGIWYNLPKKDFKLRGVEISKFKFKFLKFSKSLLLTNIDSRLDTPISKSCLPKFVFLERPNPLNNMLSNGDSKEKKNLHLSIVKNTKLITRM